jgi:hypothetical protein
VPVRIVVVILVITESFVHSLMASAAEVSIKLYAAFALFVCMLSISIFASCRVENEFRYFSKVLGLGHDVRVSSWQRFQPFHLIFRM